MLRGPAGKHATAICTVACHAGTTQARARAASDWWPKQRLVECIGIRPTPLHSVGAGSKRLDWAFLVTIILVHVWWVTARMCTGRDDMQKDLQ